MSTMSTEPSEPVYKQYLVAIKKAQKEKLELVEKVAKLEEELKKYQESTLVLPGFSPNHLTFEKPHVDVVQAEETSQSRSIQGRVPAIDLGSLVKEIRVAKEEVDVLCSEIDAAASSSKSLPATPSSARQAGSESTRVSAGVDTPRPAAVKSPLSPKKPASASATLASTGGAAAAVDEIADPLATLKSVAATARAGTECVRTLTTLQQIEASLSKPPSSASASAVALALVVLLLLMLAAPMLPAERWLGYMPPPQ